MSILVMAALLVGCNPSTPVNACHATGDPANPYQEITITTTNLNEHLGHPNDLYPVPVGGCPTAPLVVIEGKITVCHATNNQTTPYDTVTVNANGLDGHGAHAADLIPAPAGGCPTILLVANNGKITICHATGSANNPYNQITISMNGLNGHDKHQGDIIPAPAGGCPPTPLVIVAGKITVCHATNNETTPYDTVTVNVNDLDGHGAHAADLIPAPVSGCPTTPLVIVNRTITICHVNGNTTMPYDTITVNVNYLDGHGGHAADLIPAPAGGCPTTLLVANNGKITICHATSSEKNPYNLITISINGLNGHDKHEGDIIPAPGGGCPDTGMEKEKGNQKDNKNDNQNDNQKEKK